jgi:hypothetical protein
VPGGNEPVDQAALGRRAEFVAQGKGTQIYESARAFPGRENRAINITARTTSMDFFMKNPP